MRCRAAFMRTVPSPPASKPQAARHSRGPTSGRCHGAGRWDPADELAYRGPAIGCTVLRHDHADGQRRAISATARHALFDTMWRLWKAIPCGMGLSELCGGGPPRSPLTSETPRSPERDTLTGSQNWKLPSACRKCAGRTQQVGATDADARPPSGCRRCGPQVLPGLHVGYEAFPQLGDVDLGLRGRGPAVERATMSGSACEAIGAAGRCAAKMHVMASAAS